MKSENLEERVEELENTTEAMREDINLFRQNLMELSSQVENETIPVHLFEREIGFLKTTIEEFMKAKNL